jgi:hypothetical protein
MAHSVNSDSYLEWSLSDIVQHWHEMARSRMTQSGHFRCTQCKSRCPLLTHSGHPQLMRRLQKWGSPRAAQPLARLSAEANDRQAKKT